MAVYTCITAMRDSIHLTQHRASDPEAALRAGVASLPYDDGAGPFDDELDWLVRVGRGAEPIELLPVNHCPGVWLWLGGVRREPPYSTYVVRTETEPEL